MAVQLEKHRRPMNVVLRSFARQAQQQMQADFRTQHIWPYEIYPGFKRINALREKWHMWYATGEGYKSFQHQVTGGENTNNITLRFEFLQHLFYPNMGTAGGRKYETVKHERKARHNKRYVAIWDSRDGDTHRPSIMREMRHVEMRLQGYIQDYFGEELQTYIYKTFAGMHAINLDV